MKCIEVLEKLSYEVLQGNVEGEFNRVIFDSRKLERNCLFICIEGANFDGHDFALQAAKEGAAFIVVSRELPELKEYPVGVIKVEDTRYAMAFISAAFFGHPAEKLKVIGITGTKGKTTTSYMIKSILENAGFRVGLIGTIEVIMGEKHIPANGTTPESYYLQEYFAGMVEMGIQIVVMEVSSQGLMMHRTQGFVFDFGIYTNLSPDHIGPNEHRDFEHYMKCKSLLFRQCKVGLLNGDDPYVKSVLEGSTCQVETYGLSKTNDIYGENLEKYREKDALGIRFRTGGNMEIDVKLPAPGIFSAYNALAAISVCRHFAVEKEKVEKALQAAKVKGRIEPVKVSDKFTVLIDYAHNAMSLESLLETLKEYQHNRLICLFGCGGNRSGLRRFEMGEVSGKLADLTIITSDNPRKEDPMEIMKDIETGIRKTTGKYEMIMDRKEAIAFAINEAKEGDILVLAGKGHEDYQEINGIKYPMDERVLIREILSEK